MVYLSGEKIMLLKDLRVRLQYGDYLYTRSRLPYIDVMYVISHPNKFIGF